MLHGKNATSGTSRSVARRLEALARYRIVDTEAPLDLATRSVMLRTHY
jgi:hypothetical protein